MLKSVNLKLITTLWLVTLIASLLLGAYIAWLLYGERIRVGEEITLTTLTRTQTQTTATVITSTSTSSSSTSISTSVGVGVSVPNYLIVGGVVYLPLPIQLSRVSVEKAILWRRSIREYRNEPITITQLSMVLWAAQGITDVEHEFRAAPSAGPTYPLTLYVVVGEGGVRLEGSKYLKAGVYRYDVLRHTLRLIREGDLRDELSKASLNQEWVKEAPVDIVMCAVFQKTTKVYGERGVRYVYMEAGHSAQNIYLMATALNLSTVVVGAFHDGWVAEIINASKNEAPLYVIPLGVPKRLRHPTLQQIDEWYVKERGMK